MPEPDDESAERARGESVVLADTGAMLALFGLGESNTGLETDDQPSVLLPDDRADAMPEDDLAEASAGDVSLEGVDDAGGASSFDDGVEVSESEPVAGTGAWGDHTDVLAPVVATEISPLAPTEVIAGEDRVDVTAPEGHSGALAAVGLSDVFAPAATTAAYAPPAAATEDETLIGSTGSFQPARRRGALCVEQTRALVCCGIRRAARCSRRGDRSSSRRRSPRTTAQPKPSPQRSPSWRPPRQTPPQPYAIMESAFADYDAAVLSARAAADSAGPALASVAGMTDEAPLAAANAALAALVAQLDDTTLAAPPEPYERGEVDVTDLDQIAAATQTASNRAQVIATATREARAAQAALVEKVAALTAAQVSARIFAAGDRGDHRRREPAGRAELPRCGHRRVGRRARRPGGRRSGDAELLAYAAAVTALRADEARAQDERSTTPVTPPRTNPAPVPVPVP